MKKLKLLIFLTFHFSLFTFHSSAQLPNFTKVDTGAIYESTGHHIASGWFDMDNDGDMDVIITNTGKGYNNHPNLLYKNEQNGHFKQIKNTDYTNQILNVGLPGPFGDIDNDGDQDLMNPNWMGTDYYLYQNDGYGNFEYLKNLYQLYGNTSVLFDLDNDSFLDIVQFKEEMSKVYLNDGTGDFVDYENLNIPCLDPNAVLHNIALGDADNDGDFDLYIGYTTFGGSSLEAKNEFFLNQGSGVFERHSADSIIVQDLAMTPNSNWVDYDNDGDMDLYVLNTFNYDPSESVSGALFENKGDLVFEKHIIEPAGYRDANRISSVWGDLDNDADLDLYITIEKNDFNGHASPIKHNLLMQNNGDGTFSEITVGTLAEESAHTATLEDYDNDGDLDVLLVRFSWANNGNNTLCMNGGNDNSWLILTCEGTLSNKTAFGTRIIAKAYINGEAVSQVREITPMSGHCTYPSTRVHFGLGDADVIDTLLIRWPSGHVDTYLNVEANQFYRAIENDELAIDFRATNYILYAPCIPDTFIVETTTIDLKDHYHFMAGDTVPVIAGDTLTFSVYNNENPDVVQTTVNGSILTLDPVSLGVTTIKILASAGFTERVDQFVVNVVVGLTEKTLLNPGIITLSPNPCSGTARLQFKIYDQGSTILDLYSISGRKIKRLLNEEMKPGEYEMEVDMTGLPAGIYFCTLQTSDGIQTVKMVKL